MLTQIAQRIVESVSMVRNGTTMTNMRRYNKRSVCSTGIMAILWTCLTCSTASTAEWADSMFSIKSHDFGTVAAGSLVEFEFTFENPYLEDLHIIAVQSTCGCTIPRIKGNKQTYKTWEKGAIIARINTAAFSGSRGATITVTFNRPFPAKVQLHVKAHIYDGVLLTPGSIQFGTVHQGVPASKTLRITTPDRKVSIVGVETSNPHISAKLGPMERVEGRWGYSLTIKLDAKTPLGYIKDHIMLLAEGYRKTRIPVTVDGRITPTISISPKSLFMGIVAPSDTAHKRVVVRGREPFVITNVRSSDPRFVVDISKASQPKMIHILPVTFSADHESGRVTQTLYIETKGGSKAIKIEACAVVNIRNLNEVSKDSKKTNSIVAHP